MRVRKIQINIGNSLPVYSEELGPVISVWRSAEQVFSDCELLGYSITLDPTDTNRLLELVSDASKPEGESRLQARISQNLSPLGSQLTLKVTGTKDSTSLDDVIVQFLENLYLAMNLSVPGSCNLYGTSFKSSREPVRSRRRPRETVGFDLSGELFEAAANSAADRGWPKLQHIDLRQTWGWLQRNNLLTLEIAVEPWQRAVFTLLRTGESQCHYPDVIFSCVQAIEAILGQGAPASVTKRRVESILGTPARDKNWYSALQRTRSQVAHGTAPLGRPGTVSIGDYGDQMNRQFELIDLSFAVLLAVVQTLILRDATSFQIQEVINFR